ncbi:MAG: AI-2E family transporter [bacterium]
MKRDTGRLMLDISWEALLKVLAFVVGIWAVIALREVIIMLFGSFILVAAVNPTITRWQGKMSRLLAVSLFYTLVVTVLVILASFFVPTFISQMNELVHALPSILDKAQPWLGSYKGSYSGIVNQTVETVKSSLNGLSQSFLETTLSFFGGVVMVVTGAVISFYLLLEEENARAFFRQVLPHNRYEAVYGAVRKIADRMGSWVRGQVILMVIIGLSSLVAYYLLHLSSPLPLAIWAGLCELLPYIGPTIGLFPAVIVALTTGGPVQALLVLLVGYVVIQQIESHIVVPRVMSKAVGLSPVLVIVALTVGVKLFGLVGAVIAVPIAAIISVIAGEWPELRKIWESADSRD